MEADQHLYQYDPNDPVVINIQGRSQRRQQAMGKAARTASQTSQAVNVYGSNPDQFLARLMETVSQSMVEGISRGVVAAMEIIQQVQTRQAAVNSG